MAQADHASTTSTSAPERPDADARLAALLAQLLRQDEVIEAITAEELPPGRTPASDDQEARHDLAYEVRDQIVVDITATPATSARGRAAKAQALISLLDSEIATSDEASPEKLAFALAVDVLADAPTMPHVVRGDADEVLVLGLRLAAALKEEESLTDRETATKNVSARIYLNDAWLHACDEVNGLRGMIAATPATSLAGAVVQIAEAIFRFFRMRDCEGPHHQDERAIARLLFSALDVVGDAAGETDRLSGVLRNAHEHLNPWVPVGYRCKALAEVEA